MTAFDELLVSLGACEDAREWAKGKSFADVWNTCERGDWLLWLLAKMKDKPGWATHKQIVSAACDCAELSLKYVEVGEERPRVAIETARKWVRGEATLEEVKKAARKADRSAYDAAHAASHAAAHAASHAASAAYAAAHAAAHAACAAYAAAAHAAAAACAAYAAAAYAASHAASAAYAAACAACAAYDAACGADAARISILKECADLIRKSIEMPRWVERASPADLTFGQGARRWN